VSRTVQRIPACAGRRGHRFTGHCSSEEKAKEIFRNRKTEDVFNV
jgi:hypothetical protein